MSRGGNSAAGTAVTTTAGGRLPARTAAPTATTATGAGGGVVARPAVMPAVTDPNVAIRPRAGSTATIASAVLRATGGAAHLLVSGGVRPPGRTGAAPRAVRTTAHAGTTGRAG